MERIKTIKYVHILVLATLTILMGAALVGCIEGGQPSSDEYTITYAGVEDAINPNTAETYTAASGTIELLDPIKEGYPFEGWTYNGQQVSAIDGAWGQNITLVANWGEHFCHIEFEWDLPEEYRFYFLGEPFRTGFYVEGKWYELSPKVWLKFGEDGEVFIPYINGISLHVEGFDSKTVGTKHVTVRVDNIMGPNGETLSATKTYDVEVRDYDHEKYGYTTQPEDVFVSFPEGYSLSAEVRNEDFVIAYNWIDTLEYEDPEAHAEMCSTQSYNPYNFLHGSTALTNKLEVPSAFYSDEESFKLLTVYDDFTRVYSDIAVAHVEIPASAELENYARLGEYVFGPDVTRGNRPFDLSEYGIGSGTISFVKTEKGAEFTFENVNFVNNNYKCDAFNSSIGFEYFYVKGINGQTAPGEYYIHLVGDNYFTNTYLADGASGININFQNTRQIERAGIVNSSTLTIDGPGTLNLVGGSPALYANCILTIKTKINTSPYVGRNSSGIEANDITLAEGAVINSTSKGTALTATIGNIVVNDGAALDLNLVIPRREGTAAGIMAIQAGGDVRFSSDHVNISVTTTPEIYQIFDNQTEGVDKCILVSAGRFVVLENGTNANLKVLASSSQNTIPIFGMVYGLSGDSGVYIEDSTLNMEFWADLFYGIYAIAADSTVEIENSVVNVDMKCRNSMNGIYCENGNVAIMHSEVNIAGRTSYVDEAPMFGVFTGPNSAIEVIDSLLDVDFNRGLAVAAYFAWRDNPARYDEAYTPKPKLLDGFVLDNTRQMFGLYSVFAMDATGDAGFHVLETVFDTASDGIPATKVHVDNR
ncbi:MAG: InlB B-repeat-containing protein [Eggerthellaceae bacterium]|nr:InlB B-repeat-containing protein [Eggerthellaceae bacterium]